MGLEPSSKKTDPVTDKDQETESDLKLAVNVFQIIEVKKVIVAHIDDKIVVENV
jgi:hypothetical protein